MSLTYATLQTRMAAYLKRTDLTSDLPYAVSMAENEINRRLNLLAAEAIVTPTLALADDDLDFADFSSLCNSVIDLAWIDTGGRLHEIIYKDPVQMLGYFNTTPGSPRYWTVQGGMTVVFDRPADQSYTVASRIRNKWDLANTSTNWLATNHEDLYLNLSLAFMEPFTKNDKRVVVWRTFAEAAISQLDEDDTEARATRKATLTTEISRLVNAPAGYYYDINAG